MLREGHLFATRLGPLIWPPDRSERRQPAPSETGDGQARCLGGPWRAHGSFAAGRLEMGPGGRDKGSNGAQFPFPLRLEQHRKSNAGGSREQTRRMIIKRR